MFEKFKYIAFVFILAVNILSAQTSYIFDINTDNYPQIKSKYLYFDVNNEIQNLSKSEIVLREGQNVISDFDWVVPDNNTPNNLSLIFSVCLSLSMDQLPMEYTKIAINSWADNINFSTSEVAVTGFNYYNYLLQDFTTNKADLTSALDNIELFGGIDYNAAFLNEPASALKLAQKAKNKAVIVLLCDGSGQANVRDISEKAIALSAVIYCIAFTDGATKSLKDLVRATGGVTFENVNSEIEVKKICNLILALETYDNATEVTYISKTCNSRKDIIIDENLTNTFSKDYVYIEDEKISSLEYLPDNSLYFGELPAGAQNFNFIGIKSKLDTITITNIISTNPNFTPEDVFPITIPKDSSYYFKINYTSKGIGFDFASFFVLSNACRNTYFYGSAGSYDVFDGNKTLVLLDPIGNEKFVSGNDTTISWSGVPPDMPVRLDFSINAGKSWNEISPNATGLSYRWKNIPNMTSDQCLMKVTQLTKNITQDKIVIIDASEKEIFDMEWLPKRNSIITASPGGAIAIWDASTGTRSNLCFSGISNLSALAVIDDSLAVFSSSDKYIKVFKLDSTDKVELTINTLGSGITCFSEGIAGSTLLSGDNTGKVSQWNIYNPNRNYIIVAHDAPITNIVYSPDRRKFATSANGEVKIWHSSNGFNAQVLPKFDYAVNSISFSANGSQLVVSTGDRKIVCWDVVQNKEAWSKSIIDSPVYEAVFAPDTNILAICANNRSIDLLNTDKSESIFNYKFHSANVGEVKWDRSTGRYRIASADKKGFIHIWFLDDIPFYNISLQEDISKYWTIYERTANLQSIDFNKSPINIPRDTLVWAGIVNTTPLSIKLDSIFITGKDKDVFNVFFPSAVTLKSQYPLSMFYEFKPQEEKEYIADIEIFSGASRFTSKISGEGVKLVANAKPTIIDFGKIIIGGLNEDYSTLTNYSDLDIQIDSVIINDKFGVFNYTGKQKFVLNSNKSEKMLFEFGPKEIQRYSGTAKIFNSGNYSPIIIQLWGEGIESTIINDSALVFDDVICQAERIIDSLKVTNIGIDDIKLLLPKISQFDQAAFGILDEVKFPITIEANESAYVRIWFNPIKVGSNISELEMIFEYNNSSTKKIVNLKGKKEIYEISLKPNTVNFNTKANETKSDIVKIHNIGTLPFKLALPMDIGFFDLTCNNCDSLQPNDSVEVNVLFKGFSKDTNIVNIQQFFDGCVKSTNLLLVATVGIEDAQVEFPAGLNFGTIKCQGADVSKDIEIGNIGTSNLVIEEINLDDEVNFSLENNLGFIVKPGEKHRVGVRFEPKGEGDFNTAITFKSNAINTTNGLFKINLSGKSILNIWTISQDSLVFDGILENRPAERTFSINNLTLNAIKLYFSNLNNYIIKSSQPLIVPAGETYNVTVEFLGGTSGEDYPETLFVMDSCGIAKELKLSAEIRSYAEAALQLPFVKASPGDTIYVPLKLYSPENIELPDVSGYNTTISFNASLLFNFDDSIKDSVSGNVRYLILENLPALPQSDSSIYRLKLIALLTDTNKTELRIEQAKSIGKDVSILQKNGEFELINVCGDGSGISNTGVLFLSQNEPNPANQKTKIKYHLIEKGQFSLELYDYTGKLISILEEGKKKPGDYEIAINLEKYGIGAYYYVLRTATKTIIKKMIIIR
ncbi:MAG: choice-of-anchor D domain-containing protein [bacterium]